MDNFTTMSLFPTEGVTDIGQHVTDTSTDAAPLNVSHSAQSTWTTADTVELSMAGLWLYLTVRILWAGMAIFGNSLTLLAVTRFERLQTCTNYLICSLAVSDLLSGLMMPLMMVHELYPDRWFFIPSCLMRQTLSIISSAGNMLNILYLSIDRYIYIALPLRYQGLVTPCRTATLLTLTWGVCLLTVPSLVFMGNHLHVGMPCRYHIFLNDWVKHFYITPQFTVVLFLTIGFHLRIARIAHNQARRIQAQQQPYNTLDVEINQSTRKISRTLGTVLGVYIGCILPQVIMSGITPCNRHLLPLERFTIILYWTNTWVNPLIYSWRLKDFKIAFKKIFTGTGSFNQVPGIPA